jgi:endonuclease YncB( thermonuclease family)
VKLAVALGAALAMAGGAALADPCTAIPDRGPAPAWIRPGATFSGSVPYVGDGDSICIGQGPTGRDWVEVRLADFYAPELRGPGGEHARRAMMRVTSGKRVSCTVGGGKGRRVLSHDRVIAVCRIGGTSLGELMRREGVGEGGNGR